MNAAERIAHILRHCRTIAVVGLSSKPHRASFDVARYMQQQGYRIIPVNPRETQVLGERAYATLHDAAQAEAIDLVNCFRTSDEIAAIALDAMAIGAKALWMQLGISNPGAAAHAEAAGLLVVQNQCLKIDHRVLLSSGVI